MDKWIVLLMPLLPLVVIGAGIYSISVYKRKLRTVNTTKTWLRTNGIVTNVNVAEKRDDEIKEVIVKDYTVIINYSYQVGDKTFTGNKFKIDCSTNKNYADNKKNEFSKGKQVPVLYNPSDPEKVMVESETKNVSSNLFIGIFLVIIGIGGAIAVISDLASK